MAIVMRMDWDGITVDQYDTIEDLVGWRREPPQGGIYHVAAIDQTGLHVTDVWESAEDFQRFVDTRLMPGVEQMGIAGEPRVVVYPVHKIWAPASGDRQMA